MTRPSWTPSETRVAQSNMTAFREAVEEDWNVGIADYPALHAFSLREPEKFWRSLREFCCVSAESWGTEGLVNAEQMPGARWFPGARLNYAENLLQRRDGADAIVFWGEDRVRRRLSYGELYDLVSRLVQLLKAEGVKPGDRVCGFLPNLPETIAAMLAAASMGAVWSSCSPDFGPDAVIDRFSQISPKLLFTADGYFYGGKSHDSLETVARLAESLPSLKSIVVVPYSRARASLRDVPKAVHLEDALLDFRPAEIAFVRLPFDHPLMILFSSGTTGVPKCIVHGAGGTLLQHLKEHRLHSDIRPDDRVFYFTTCGWMMWNWLVSVLASQATLLLYDGSPFHKDGTILFDYADAENMTFFGTSAKYIDALAKAGLVPKESHRLRSLRAMASTGSPLAPASFDYVYGSIKEDLHLASISGGTDIVSCFVLGDPTRPVWRGEIQAPGLGMAVEVWDEAGKPVASGAGELVCTQPFPSMPVGFWNDAEGKKYRDAYFDRFPGVWRHGDYLETTAHGGYVIHGRSDATLNPGGVRIGTAEIYRQVEKVDAVLESIAVGQEWEDDVRIILFVVLRPGVRLGESIERKIRNRIVDGCTRRHLPAKILQVSDIPRTKSGKISEIAVRETIHGRKVGNLGALANPQSLEHFTDLAELKTDGPGD